MSLEISQNYFSHHEGNREQFVSMFGPRGAKDPNQSSTSIPPENERKPLFCSVMFKENFCFQGV